MALGNLLAGPQQQQQPIHPALAQSMAPQAVARDGQTGGGLGALFANLQQNPAAIQMLLASGAQMLNPQQFGSPGGRIAQAVSDGVSGYNELKTAQEDKEFERGIIEGREDREDRKVDLTEEQLDQEEDQFLKSFGLEEAQLEGQKALWKAQSDRYAAQAEALRKKTELAGQGGVDPSTLTGPERMTNKLAQIIEANGVPADRAYTMAFDIYNKSGEGKAKAIAGAAESLAFLASTPKGQELYENVMSEIESVFNTGTDILDTVQSQNQGAGEESGVTQEEINAALEASNRNSGTNLTWEQLTPMQREQLKQQIRDYKESQND